MMRKNTRSVVIGLMLLPVSAFASLNDTMQVQRPYIPKGPTILLAQSDKSVGSEQQSQQKNIKLNAEMTAETLTEDILHSGELMPASNQSKLTPIATSTRNQEKIRVDKIKSIVSNADASTILEQHEKQLSQPVTQKRIVNSTQQRRQQLREIIVAAPPTKDKFSSDYVSILNDEVSSSVVIEKVSARRTAVPATANLNRSEASMLTETADAYLYTVRSGDSLWRIAQRFYQDGDRYVDLCQANRDALIDEDMLHVGQVLRVPKAVE